MPIARKNFGFLILLSLVTLGIYYFYYIYVTTKEINILAESDPYYTQAPMAVLWSILTLGIYTFFWFYKQGNRLQSAGASYGIKIKQNGNNYVFWLIINFFFAGLGFIVALYLFTNNFNKVADAHNSYHLNNYRHKYKGKL